MRKPLVFLLFAWLLWLWPLWAEGQARQPGAIQILSPSHYAQGVNEVSQGKGVLELLIHSPSPILEIRVDGRALVPTGSTTSRQLVPFWLQEGQEKIIKIEVQSQTGQASQEFRLARRSIQEAATAQSQSSVKTRASLGGSDNLTSQAAASDQVAARRFALEAWPSYHLQWGRRHEVALEGYLKAVSYQNPGTEDGRESSLLAQAGYLLHLPLTLWRLDVGRAQEEGQLPGLEGEFTQHTRSFWRLQIQPQSAPEHVQSYFLEVSQRQMKEDYSIAYDPSGRLTHLGVRQKGKSPGSDSWSLALLDMDGKGPLQDARIWQESYGRSYPLSPGLVARWDLSSQQAYFLNKDPDLGERELTLLHQALGGLSFEIAPTWSAFLEAATLQQSSNRTSRNFLTHQAQLALEAEF